MNKFLTLILILAVNLSFGQKEQTVVTNAGVDDVYFSFANAEVKRLNRTTWDIGFTLKGFDASITINENAGVALYLYGSDVNAWNSVDTAGFAWANSYNSEESWSKGAFANQGTSHPDYGWGTYVMTNHDINGDRIFIIKLSNGSYKQIMITKMSAAGVYSVKTADLGGANTSTFTITKTDAAYTGKNFVLYSLVNNAVVNEEPVAASWDILFTKYISLIPAGPQVLPYLVSGVKVNAGYEVAERTGLPTSSNDTSTLVWNKKITEIGSDWKTFNNTTFGYDIVPELTYFVRTTQGEVWKIYFTAFKGGAEGGYYFTTEKIQGGASVNDLKVLNSTIYPNPATSQITLRNNENALAEVSLSDMQGRVISTFELSAFETKELNTSSLSRGIYNVVFLSENATSSKKLILE